MSKIYIRTYAYNAEKTIERAIESVLNQTYTNFIYYLCDNGSTDQTGQIIKAYAKKDQRIRPFHNQINRNFNETKECLLLPYQIGEEDFYCTLDADDEYDSRFFEEMLAFIKANDLDIAVCGSDFLSVADNNRLTRRMLDRDLILQGKDFEKLFPCYHIFMRTVWGKLYKGKVMKNTVQAPTEPGFPYAYGGDTFSTMRAFTSAKRVGILSGTLHKYYVSKKSVSYQFHPQRVECDQILHKAALEYLAPYGSISRKNEDFLFCVYLNALMDTARVLLNASIPITEKIEKLSAMFDCEYTKQLAAKDNFGMAMGMADEMQQKRTVFFSILAKWLLSLEEVSDDLMELYCQIGEFVCAASEMSDEWIIFNKLRIQFFLSQSSLEQAEKKLAELEEILPDDTDLIEFREQIIQLENK